MRVLIAVAIGSGLGLAVAYFLNVWTSIAQLRSILVICISSISWRSALEGFVDLQLRRWKLFIKVTL